MIGQAIHEKKQLQETSKIHLGSFNKTSKQKIEFSKEDMQMDNT